MAKSKIFITSSERTLLLAEKLCEQLSTAYCEADLWKAVEGRKPSKTRIEILEEAAKEYDFAVVILTKDDVRVKGAGDTLKARYDCVFEAGLFMAAIGRKRCFLVNSVLQSDLPSDLGGLIPIPFKDPPDFENREACGQAIRDASGTIKDRVQQDGRIGNRVLSQQALLEREKGSDEGGDLSVDQVVVTAVQPLDLTSEVALQVGNNVDGGIRYYYFFQGNSDGAQKTCQLLQLVLLAHILKSKDGAEEVLKHYGSRRDMVKDNQNKIVEYLKQICSIESIKIYFLPASPDLEYCIHNAGDDKKAKMYVKHEEEFIEWKSGKNAYDFWQAVKVKQGANDPQPPYAVFYGVPGFTGLKCNGGPFLRTLNEEVRKHFPEIADKVMKLCLEGPDEQEKQDQPAGAVAGMGRQAAGKSQFIKRHRVFISYSRHDTEWLDRLLVHTKPLERDGLVDLWNDTRIRAGSLWKEEIKKALESAKVAVLFISADFLASDFIATDELPPMLEAAQTEGMTILPVIVSPCRFLQTAKLACFETVNDPAKPLIGLTKNEQETLFVKVVGEIERALNSR